MAVACQPTTYAFDMSGYFPSPAGELYCCFLGQPQQRCGQHGAPRGRSFRREGRRCAYPLAWPEKGPSRGARRLGARDSNVLARPGAPKPCCGPSARRGAEPSNGHATPAHCRFAPGQVRSRRLCAPRACAAVVRFRGNRAGRWGVHAAPCG